MSPSDQSFLKKLKQFQNTAVDPKKAVDLSKPWSDPKTALSEEDKNFLEDLMKKIKASDIKLHVPSSILHQAVYEKLSDSDKAKADIWIQATLARIRQIADFYDNPYDNNSDMMIDMLKDLRLKKETLEKELGDILKI